MPRYFSIGVLSSEGPFDTSAPCIETALPSIDLGGECGTIWQTPAEALAIKDADFDFGQVKPTGMLRGVVEYGAAQQRLRFLDAEHFLKQNTRGNGY